MHDEAANKNAADHAGMSKALASVNKRTKEIRDEYLKKQLHQEIEADGKARQARHFEAETTRGSRSTPFTSVDSGFQQRHPYLNPSIAHELLRVDLRDVARIAAPTVVFQMPQPLTCRPSPHGGGLHGIEMDVARDRQQVALVFDQLGLEAALEHVARPAVLVAGIQCVRRQEPLHETRQVRPRRADQQMKMIAHEDIGKQLDIGEAKMVCKLGEKALAVGVVLKDRRAAVAATGDVIQGVGKIDAWRAGHSLSVSRRPVAGKLL